jgi:hypothetical protein
MLLRVQCFKETVGNRLTNMAATGYVADPTQEIRGISPLHDSGTGSSSGSYGNFAVSSSPEAGT